MIVENVLADQFIFLILRELTRVLVNVLRDYHLFCLVIVLVVILFGSLVIIEEVRVIFCELLKAFLSLLCQIAEFLEGFAHWLNHLGSK